eukprot:1698695-Rhodomonas_salina.1
MYHTAMVLLMEGLELLLPHRFVSTLFRMRIPLGRNFLFDADTPGRYLLLHDNTLGQDFPLYGTTPRQHIFLYGTTPLQYILLHGTTHSQYANSPRQYLLLFSTPSQYFLLYGTTHRHYFLLYGSTRSASPLGHRSRASTPGSTIRYLSTGHCVARA